MNKKLEAAAMEYADTHFIPNMHNLYGNIVADFKAGSAYGRQDALREAIEICNKNIRKKPSYKENDYDVGWDAAFDNIKEELEQLLSSEGEK